jgi:hypothetical protein
MPAKIIIRLGRNRHRSAELHGGGFQCPVDWNASLAQSFDFIEHGNLQFHSPSLIGKAKPLGPLDAERLIKGSCLHEEILLQALVKHNASAVGKLNVVLVRAMEHVKQGFIITLGDSPDVVGHHLAPELALVW